jgi:hypothetical protein
MSGLLDDGPEVLLTLAVPMNLRLLSELCSAIAEGAQRAGYTDVAMLTDGTNRIVARRIERAEDGS